MIHRTSNGWFYFSFTRADYRSHGENRINIFIVKMRQHIPIKDRHYYPEENEWQVKEEHKGMLIKLYQKICIPNYQRKLDF